jgi:hypothetical protein
MEQLDRWVYGFLVFLGGVSVIIFTGFLLVDFFTKMFYYFTLISLLILVLYGIFLAIASILLMSVSNRIKKYLASSVISIGMVVITLSSSAIIIGSFTPYNFIEITSGIVLIAIGISLLLKKGRLIKDTKRKVTRGSHNYVPLGLGLLIVTLSFTALVAIFGMYTREYALSQLPTLLSPLLLGFLVTIYGVCSIVLTQAPQKRINTAIFPILKGFIIILVFLSVLFYVILPVTLRPAF